MKKIILIISLCLMHTVCGAGLSNGEFSDAEKIFGKGSHPLILQPTSVYRIVGEMEKFDEKKIATCGYLGARISETSPYVVLFFSRGDLIDKTYVNSFLIEVSKKYEYLYDQKNVGKKITIVGKYLVLQSL